MRTIQLKINTLRRRMGISQQVLADALGVTFQTVSKWENMATMPDICMLPAVADFFQVTVDQLLGLQPLPGEEYVPAQTGTREYWDGRLEYLRRSRRYLWNQDYLSFLVEKVWNISEPVNVLDCGCGWGFLAYSLLPLLPEGSTYTGIDLSEKLIEEGKRLVHEGDIRFVTGDVLDYESDRKYGMVICQAVLRHIGNADSFLDKMISVCSVGGIVVCIDVNREIESDGLYIEGMDYSDLCERPGFRTMWKTELEKQNRDYAAGIRVPEKMVSKGLSRVDCRMNDKVNFITTQKEDHANAVGDLTATRGWDQDTDEPAAINRFMNHGMSRAEAEDYCRKQRAVRNYIEENRDQLSAAVVGGLMISYGWKD